MAPSQLKQLKASLHTSGVLGPQKSKKQKKSTAKDASARLQRTAALESIREKFNPFEVQTTTKRAPKYEFVTNKEAKANNSKGRPGVTRSLGEERRRETLLRELQRRNKVGGVLDRRFGENDPTLTPEERAAERFARENERRGRKGGLFNLEDESDEEVEMALTHGGRSLAFGGEVVRDDYEEDDGDRSDAEEFQEQNDRPKKRLRLEDEGGDGEDDEEAALPERKKTKSEVMKEVIAKSKMYKAERQAAKEDDEDLRLELDKGMSDLYEAMRSHKPAAKPLPTPPSDSEPQMDPARAAMLAGKSREDAEKEYEANIRQMKMDARSKPSVRTKTEEEKAAEEAERLQELEKRRLQRMQGQEDSSDGEEIEDEPEEDEERDDAEAFGLSAPAPMLRPELEVEDEDEFVLDDDLVASGSDLEPMSDDESSGSEVEDDGDDDFVNGLVLPKSAATETANPDKDTGKGLAYTYPCPQTHEEFLDLLNGTEVADVPTVVQRIRALYHKGLAEDNEAKLGKFAYVLLEHIAYMGNSEATFNATVIEALFRHLHSMAKAQPRDVSSAFRTHLITIAVQRPLALTGGDLMVLTGVSTIFPTSDQFHTVATPAMLTIGRYLGQAHVQTLSDLATGAYCCTLALQYQQYAKRYVPEVVTYIVNAIAILSPTHLPTTLAIDGYKGQPLNTPIRLPDTSLRVRPRSKAALPPKPSLTHLLFGPTTGTANAQLLQTFIHLTAALPSLWSTKTAYPSLILPLIHCLTHLTQTPLPSPLDTLLVSTLSTLQSTLSTTTTARLPLHLHAHRPLAIKQSLPAFTDNYNPNRHPSSNDPDPARAQLSKLRAEHKKERKGAMRELRKDANFVAREQLREKKEKDDAYEKKFRRLVAEIQGEEGREGKGYEREKSMRREKKREKGRK